MEIFQNATNRTIAAIESISQVMKEVDGVVTTIAAATVEHSATTKSISSNVGDTTDRIKEMSGSVKKGALALFTREHFDREERIMTSGGYPGLSDQQSAHIALLEKMDVYL